MTKTNIFIFTTEFTASGQQVNHKWCLTSQQSVLSPPVRILDSWWITVTTNITNLRMHTITRQFSCLFFFLLAAWETSKCWLLLEAKVRNAYSNIHIPFQPFVTEPQCNIYSLSANVEHRMDMNKEQTIWKRTTAIWHSSS